MIQYYRLLHKDVRIYEIHSLPTDHKVFLHDQEHKDYWGSCMYTLHCPDGFMITYNNDEETDTESLFVEIKGEKKSKTGDIYYGNSYCITNSTGAYICMYCVESGNIYTQQENIHVLFHAKQLLERQAGDQLGQIFIPDTATVTKKDNIDYIT